MINLAGQKFSFLTVLSFSHKKQQHQYWLCSCVCGNKKAIRKSHFISGNIKSCGCKRKPPVVSVGDIFGRLTVSKLLPKRDEYKTYRGGDWLLCNCFCGKTTTVYSSNLRNGNTTSCGCYARELSVKLGKKYGKDSIEKGYIKPGNLLSKTHGEAGKTFCLRTVEYSAWASMIECCYDTGSDSYKYTGAKGIKVCSSWLSENDGYKHFLSDMRRKPDKDRVLMRINIKTDFTPENTKWGSRKESTLTTPWHLEHADEISQIENYYFMSGSLRQYYLKKLRKQREAEKKTLPASQIRLLTKFQSEGI